LSDNSTYDPGAGGDTYRSKDRAGIKTEVVGLDLNPAGAETLMAGTMPVSAASLPLPAGASTAAKQPAFGTAGAAATDVVTIQGIASGTVVPVSGTVTASGPLTDAQLRATAVPVSGTVTADTEMPAAAALADGAANPTTPTVGAGGLLWNGTTWDRAKGDTTNGAYVNVKAMVALPTGANVIGALSANQSVNGAQVAGTATSVNSGTKDAGTQRVILASDQTVVPVSDNSGSLTVDAPVGTPAFVRLSDGAAAITTLPVSLASLPALAAGSALAGRVNLDPQTANGLSIFHLVSAGSTNATNVKASAGQVYGWFIYNSNAAARKVVFHNTAGTPTAGASVSFALMIPATSAANVEMTNGLAFATGIAITTVTDLTDAGATAVAANDLIINIFYK
jgi:hypothetical protein